MRKCEGCGIEFEPHHGSQRYCTYRCRWAHHDRKRSEYHSAYSRRYYDENRDVLLKKQRIYRERRKAC